MDEPNSVRLVLTKSLRAWVHPRAEPGPCTFGPGDRMCASSLSPPPGGLRSAALVPALPPQAEDAEARFADPVAAELANVDFFLQFPLLRLDITVNSKLSC